MGEAETGKVEGFHSETPLLGRRMQFAAVQFVELPMKIKFAIIGYSFSSTPFKPAIQLFRTRLKTVSGMYRGVQATNLIFFSYFAWWHEAITASLPKYHQVPLYS